MFKMKYNNNKIADILIEERKKKGWSQEKLIEKLAEKKVYVGRNTISAIESSAKHDIGKLSLELLIALAELYDCEIGYLLGEYPLKTGRDTDIQEETGLSAEAINTIKGIKQESENWKADWNRYKKIYSSQNIKFDNPGYDDLAALNFMLKYNAFISPILRGLQDLCHAEYTIPVHLENGKFVVPNNNYEHQPETEVPGGKFPEYYYLLLARSKDTPNDNIPIALDYSFFKSLALKTIENTFLDMLEVYKENKK